MDPQLQALLGMLSRGGQVPLPPADPRRAQFTERFPDTGTGVGPSMYPLTPEGDLPPQALTNKGELRIGLEEAARRARPQGVIEALINRLVGGAQ